MKKILACLLTLALTVAFLAACNGGKEPVPTTPPTSGESQPGGFETDAATEATTGKKTEESTTSEPTAENTTRGSEEPSSEASQPPTTTKNPLVETSGSGGGNGGGGGSSEDLNRYYTPHSYSYATPKSSSVGLSWFDDAVFMGDSRSVGLLAYTGLKNSTTAKDYTKVSLTIFGYDSKAVTTIGGVACTTSQALRKISFSKVYIAFGMNECGYSKSGFISKYREVIRDIKAINPSAKIYVEDILPVTAAKSANSDVFNNPRINEYNEALMQLAREEGVYFLAVSENMKRNGALPSDEAAKDGLHFGGSLCRIWLYYLRTHTGN